MFLRILGKYQNYKSSRLKRHLLNKGNSIIALHNSQSVKHYTIRTNTASWSQIKYDSNIIYCAENDVVTDLIVLSQTGNDYALQRNHYDDLHMRQYPHFRIRESNNLDIMAFRSILATSVVNVLTKDNYMWLQLPVLTTNDCEGGGDCFQVVSPFTQLFSNECHLTVSTQLHAEAAVVPFGKIFSFSPIFRAENSQTTRHLNEFWMLEAEISHLPCLSYLMDTVEIFLRKLGNSFNENAQNRTKDIEVLARLRQLQSGYYFRLNIDEFSLFSSCFSKRRILTQKESLNNEEEKWVCSILKSPVFVTRFPLVQKAFYMKSDGGITDSFDLLLPGVGEVVGGGLRESSYTQIMKNLNNKKICAEKILWYVGLRKQGYTYTGGYGLGFERLLMYILGVENIKDVIFSPRAPGLVLL